MESDSQVSAAASARLRGDAASAHACARGCGGHAFGNDNRQLADAGHKSARIARECGGVIVSSDSTHGLKDGPDSAGQMREYLSVRECAAITGLCGQSIRRAVHRRELRGFLLGHSLRIRRRDLEAWIQDQEWSPALCAERTARPCSGRRKRTASIAEPEAGAVNGDAAVTQ